MDNKWVLTDRLRATTGQRVCNASRSTIGWIFVMLKTFFVIGLIAVVVLITVSLVAKLPRRDQGARQATRSGPPRARSGRYSKRETSAI